ncbi:hypothetical protein PPERSA_10508 [Pseudocohnilembus persalinus]|uniref:Intraflagellar transport protein 56 n=1 Tax=Pseudocohnilembus persalinus TaxID=266149 RepID=A0A0V0R7F4_PSEPJ|nr:hypothetical protein PPERSA_10508 [Pseudocohnilembus persalinus]|eukprot:KRX10409.1 hypothetical protein PPERSA_10508 [Pseudocohnilembus persalinus]
MYRPGSSLSKAKGSKNQNQYGIGIPVKKIENQIPKLEDFVKSRDWVGAITLLEHEQGINMNTEQSMKLAYCKFHLGDYRKAIVLYDQIQKQKDYNKMTHLYKACCYYALLNYDDAKREALKGPECPLQNRLMFHIAHKKNDEKNLMTYHYKLQETTTDQLSLAAIHFLRSHFEEANDIYKKLLLESRDYHAINYYVALCYYKMDCYDVSLDILASYLNQYPTSVLASNLKACIQFQQISGKAAEDVFKQLQHKYESGDLFQDNDLLRHNQVVFSGGENAQSVLPKLLDVFPEARLNLAIYYLKNDEIQEAFQLIKDLEPTVPREYIIKAVVHAQLGQQTDSKEHLKVAQQLFQLVGSSASECDTIPGRQCMASCFFLLKQFDDVMVYMDTISQFYETEKDDDFSWNYAISNIATGNLKKGEQFLTSITNEKILNDESYVKWLIRMYIKDGRAANAWDTYVSLDTTSETLSLLELIANDCYKMGHFYYSAKAFDILARLNSDKEYEDALRGAVVGVFQMVIAKKESPDHLIEVMGMLKAMGNSPQVEYIFKVISKWAKENDIDLM